MQIKKVAVENFRGIRKASTTVHNLTALIGENNACKSTFLKAIDLFFGTETKLRQTDYHHRAADASVFVTITLQTSLRAIERVFRARAMRSLSLASSRKIRTGPPGLTSQKPS